MRFLHRSPAPAGGVREPAVAGMFYAGSPDRLADEVDGHVARARRAMAEGDAPPVLADERLVAVVAPHAGHIYSGPTAGFSYAAIDPAAVRRVVLLGPAHYVPVEAIGLSTASAWRTPLGDVPLDADVAADLRAHFDSVEPADEAHAPEHSLEVQVPFLQRVLEPGWTLVPLIVGFAIAEEVAAVIARCAALPGTLIVVSTDLSHYLDHDTAAAHDARTIEVILARREADIGSHDACGRYPLRGLLAAAEAGDWTVRLLDARNSGDTAGDWDRVVGYAAFAVTAPVAAEAEGGGAAVSETSAGASGAGASGGAGAAGGAVGADADPVEANASGGQDEGGGNPGGGGEAGGSGTTGRIPPEARTALLGLARRTIEQALRSGGRRPSFDPSGWDPVLRQPGAAFVTLRSADGALLGCIGSLAPRQALAADVAEHAFDAAFRDPRFPPMTPDRAEGMVIDVSVLSPTRPFPCDGYDDLLARLPAGSGVVVDAGRHRATFLPAVWEQLPDRGAFLAALWRKAGLRPGEWPPGTRIEVYGSEEFAEA